MKKNVWIYSILTGIISLSFLLAACGKTENPIEQPTEATTAQTESTQHTVVSRVYFSDELRVCLRDAGELILMDAESKLYAIPYDEATCQIIGVDGAVLIDVSELETGDRVRVEHNGDITADGMIRFSYVYSISKELDASAQQCVIHGVVVSAGETLVIHPYPERMLTGADQTDREACYEIRLTGVPCLDSMGMLSESEWKVGDFVEVQLSQEALDAATQATVAGAPKQLGDVYSISRCENNVRKMAVREIQSDRLILEDVALGRNLFDEGKVLDTNGRVVLFEHVRVGDVLEVQYGGLTMPSLPGQLSHIHIVWFLGIVADYPTMPIQPRVGNS